MNPPQGLHVLSHTAMLSTRCLLHPQEHAIGEEPSFPKARDVPPRCCSHPAVAALGSSTLDTSVGERCWDLPRYSPLRCENGTSSQQIAGQTHSKVRVTAERSWDEQRVWTLFLALEHCWLLPSLSPAGTWQQTPRGLCFTAHAGNETKNLFTRATSKRANASPPVLLLVLCYPWAAITSSCLEARTQK